MSYPLPTIAFFGSTGGVTNSTLVNALRSGAHVVALVRTPSKLTAQLRAQNISEATISSQLTLITGNALDVAAVKSTLTANNTPNHIVSHIVSGIGGAPTFAFDWTRPFQLPITIDNPTICGSAAQTLTTALRELYTETPALAQRKPTLTFVSTTGISNSVEDVPFWWRFLYHQLLFAPHKDKRVMEATFRGDMEGRDAVFGGLVGVRPTLLTGGVDADSGIGWEKLRVGREREPALGYFVSRADVGQWIWVNVVGDEKKRKEWEGEMVTLTN